MNAYNAENGTNYVYRGSAEGADQAGVVEQLLAEDWDAICVVPFDSESLAPVLEKAREQGIVVITHEASSMDPKYFDYDVEAFVNADYGTHFAEELADLAGGEGKYLSLIHISFLRAVFFQQNCRDGILPQLLLAGTRRKPRKGGQVRLCLRHRQVSARPGEVSKEREQNQLERCAGLSGDGDVYKRQDKYLLAFCCPQGCP